MTRRGYRTAAQKEGRSAGQRQRRMARERKRSMREANLYRIAVRESVVSESQRGKNELAVYGVYRKDDEWVLSAMAVRRSEERLVSDRQGATRSEVVDELVVVPRRGGELRASDGLELERFKSKSDAMSSVGADCSNRLDTGEYVVRASEWSRGMKTHKVDRDEYREWCRSTTVRSV